MSWETCEREDLRMIPTMSAKGYKVVFNDADVRAGRVNLQNIPQHAVKFVNGIRHIWRAVVPYGMPMRGSKVIWMAAELIDGNFKYQTRYPTLEAYLEAMMDQDFWRAVGSYFGYPDCCITDFVNRNIDDYGVPVHNAETTKEQNAAARNGFVPCHRHAVLILQKSVTIEQLISNRKNPKPFPDVDHEDFHHFKSSFSV